ncbi:hypothetical protein TNCV_4924281 [Trichonephila clavipes]|nr:hypothetical protein TNCV_4924281 [Trichonephila clavipes]
MRQTYWLASTFPGPQLLGFFFWNQLKSPVYEKPAATVEGFPTWVVVVSVYIASTPDLFESMLQPFVFRCRLCSITNAGRNFKPFLGQSHLGDNHILISSSDVLVLL